MNAETKATPAGAAPLEGVRTTVQRTFLITDIEGSTELWERGGDEFRRTLELHAGIVRAELRRFGGQELSEAGDGFLIAFANPTEAFRCAVAVQRALGKAAWPPAVGALRVRMGIDLGAVEVRENGEYRGVVLHRAARVGAAAHGGQVVCSSAVAQALAGESESIDLGIYRLRGISLPERIHQICWPDMPRREFPRLRAVPAFKTNLTSAGTRFFGREKEIASIRAILLGTQTGTVLAGESGVRLMTLTGPGGTGKTRLSLAVAERLLAQFSGAIWFIALAELADATLLPDRIRDALEVPEEPGTPPLELVGAFLAAESALLVLDNFEHLGQPGAACLQALLVRAPRLRCLVTSRQRLHLPGEREFSVPPLRVPEKDASLDRLAESESVQLFVDRAQGARADFALNERNAAAVGELCRRLEGVPLAIELAAARADVVAPREMLHALGSRLDFFASESPHLPARHRSLRAAIDWSYDFLPSALREFFANLSVFRGGWTAEAAHAVAVPAELESQLGSTLRALSELRGNSFIRAEEGEETMRFAMLETMRQYGADRLARDGREETVRLRHLRYFCGLAEAAERAQRQNDQIAWLQRLDRDGDNLRAALDAPLGEVDRATLAAALAHFWMVRGQIAEGRATIARCHPIRGSLPEAIRAQLDNAEGILAWTAGDFPAARVVFERALAHFRQVGDQRNVAGLLSNLGIVVAREGDRSTARRLFEESLKVYAELALDAQRAQVLANLGGLFTEMGELPEAERTLNESLAIQQRLGDAFGAESTLHNLALVGLRRGQPGEAEALALRSLAYCCRLGHLEGMASTCDLLGHLMQQGGRPAEAARWLSAAHALMREHEVGTQFRNEGAIVQDLQWARAQLEETAFLVSVREGEALAREWARATDRSEMLDEAGTQR